MKMYVRHNFFLLRKFLSNIIFSIKKKYHSMGNNTFVPYISFNYVNFRVSRTLWMM
jgi:hypothetical protein